MAENDSDEEYPDDPPPISYDNDVLEKHVLAVTYGRLDKTLNERVELLRKRLAEKDESLDPNIILKCMKWCRGQEKLLGLFDALAGFRETTHLQRTSMFGSDPTSGWQPSEEVQISLLKHGVTLDKSFYERWRLVKGGRLGRIHQMLALFKASSPSSQLSPLHKINGDIGKKIYMFL
jgi:hypothetical protein